MPSFGLVDTDYQMRLRDPASHADGPFYVLSLTRLRPGCLELLGQQSGADPDSRYAPIQLLAVVGATLCFVAEVVAGQGGWHRAGIIRYPTRRAFAELTSRRDTREWVARKMPRAERLTMLGAVPAGALPSGELSQRVLLEIWHGPVPPPVARGPAAEFKVEGTLVGDGRQWSGVRYTTIAPGTALPLEPARFGYQALLLKPVIERWS